MSTTVDIPGGQAVLRDQAEMTERHRRPIKVLSMTLARVFGKLAAGEVDEVDPEADDGMEVIAAAADMTPTEAAAFLQVNDATIYAHLKSWTLDLPLPASLDEVQDIPSEVYDALLEATARSGKELLVGGAPAVDGFDPSAAGDVASPTGASGA